MIAKKLISLLLASTFLIQGSSHRRQHVQIAYYSDEGNHALLDHKPTAGPYWFAIFVDDKVVAYRITQEGGK